ncbi:MAG: hypothetical protein ACOCP8_04170 [archaeon]
MNNNLYKLERKNKHFFISENGDKIRLKPNKEFKETGVGKPKLKNGRVKVGRNQVKSYNIMKNNTIVKTNVKKSDLKRVLIKLGYKVNNRYLTNL